MGIIVVWMGINSGFGRAGRGDNGMGTIGGSATTRIGVRGRPKFAVKSVAFELMLTGYDA